MPFQLAGVTAVRPNPLKPTKGGTEHGKERPGSVTILDIGRGHMQGEKEAEGIYQTVSLSSCNFLTRIKATNSGLASCSNTLAVNDRSRGSFFLP